MPVPLIYHDDYSPLFPAEHRFPMDKFRLLRDHLVESGLTCDADLLRPELCPVDILALAHDRAYIERYMAGELAREDQRRLGLPWSEALARRTVRAVGGSLLAAEQALSTGWPVIWPAAPITRTTITRQAFAFSMTWRSSAATCWKVAG